MKKLLLAALFSLLAFGANAQVVSAPAGCIATLACLAKNYSAIGGTITTNTPGLGITQTWNAGGTTFQALDIDIANTASAGNSNFIRLHSGASVFFLYRASDGFLNSTGTAQFGNSANGEGVGYNGAGVFTATSGYSLASNMDSPGPDVFLTRSASGVAKLGSTNGGTDAQLQLATVNYKGTIPTVSGTGTPTIATGSTDSAGEVTGGVAATSIVITFASAKTNAPFCVVTSQTQLTTFAYTISTTAITISETATTGDKIDYACFQR